MVQIKSDLYLIHIRKLRCKFLISEDLNICGDMNMDMIFNFNYLYPNTKYITYYLIYITKIYIRICSGIRIHIWRIKMDTYMILITLRLYLMCLHPYLNDMVATMQFLNGHKF
jgi:hypothetical protein